MSKEYDDYIYQHCSDVKKAYDWLVSKGIIEDKKYEIALITTMHDESKFDSQEYDAYDKYFYGEKTDKVKEDFNYAWLHHIHKNKHHWQHWVLINDEDGTFALEMPYKYVVEMICDWWSFSHKIGKLDTIFEWYNSHKEKMILHNNTRTLVENLLDKIKEKLSEELL